MKDEIRLIIPLTAVIRVSSTFSSEPKLQIPMPIRIQPSTCRQGIYYGQVNFYRDDQLTKIPMDATAMHGLLIQTLT